MRFSRNSDFSKKKKNAKSITDAPIWVKSISKNSNTLRIEHSLLNSLLSFPAMDFIAGPLILLTNPIHRILGLFVNIYSSVIEPF